MFWVGLLVQWNEKNFLAAETYERISGCFSPKVSAMEMFGRISGCFSRVKWGSLKFSLNGWRVRSKQSQSPRSLQSESAWLKCGHREIIILSNICSTSANFIYAGPKFPDKIVECWHFFSPEEPFVKCYKSWDKNKTVLRTHRYIWHFVFDVRHVPRFLHLWIYQTFKGLLNPVCGLRTCVKKFLHLIWSIKDNYLAAWAAQGREWRSHRWDPAAHMVTQNLVSIKEETGKKGPKYQNLYESETSTNANG